MVGLAWKAVLMCRQCGYVRGLSRAELQNHNDGDHIDLSCLLCDACLLLFCRLIMFVRPPLLFK